MPIFAAAASLLASSVLWGFGSPAAAGEAVTCADTAATDDAAVIIARSCHREVVVSAMTSEVASWVAQPDGLLRFEQNVLPQRVKRGMSWVPVDTTLTRTADGTVAPAASTLDVHFSGGGNTALASVKVEGGTAAMSWPSPLPAPLLEGDTAVYREVLSGVDLRVRATSSGFTHVLVIKDRAAAANPALAQVRFTWSTTGLTLAAGVQPGTMELRSGSKVVLGSLPAMMWDSTATESGLAGAELTRAVAQGDVSPIQAGDPSDATAPGDFAQTASVGVALQGQQMVLTPDLAVLSDPDTTFPVYVDPPWPSTLMRWFYANNNGNNRTDGIARVGGNPDGSGIYRSLFEFQLGDGIKYRPVYQAKFYSLMTHSGSCDSTQVSLKEGPGISTSYSSGSRIPWTAANIVSHIDLQYGHANEVTPSVCSGGVQPDWPVEFNGALTSKVQAWTQAGWGSTTLILSAADASGSGESNTYYWKKFDPSSAQTRFVIWYNYAPNVPTAKAFTGNDCSAACSTPATVRTTSPTLISNVSDPDGGQVWADYEVRTAASDTAALAASAAGAGPVASGADLSWPVPAGALTSGSTYYWRSRARDEVGYVSGWTGWQTFTIDTAAPAVPAVTSSQYPNPGWGAVVNTPGTFALSSASADTYAFTWNIDGGASTSTPATGASPRTASVTWTPATDMGHTLNVYAKDSAGNISGTYTYPFLVSPATTKFAWWKFDETSGTTAADSGSGGSSLSPGTVSAGSFTTGYVGNAITLTGVSSRVTAAGPVLDTTKSFTVMAWVRPSNLAAQTKQTVLSQDGTTTSRFQLQFQQAANGGAGGWCMVMTGDANGTTTAVACADGSAVGVPVDGQWVHLAGVYDAAAAKLSVYVMGGNQTCNGELTETAAPGSWSATGNFIIGRGWASGAGVSYWRGDVDDARAYQRVLNDTEICQIVG